MSQHPTIMNPAEATGSATPPSSRWMVWVVRIVVTIFSLPFLAVGLMMTFGGGLLSREQYGPSGWIVTLFGLAFTAVPVLMVLAVWFASPRPGVQAGFAAAGPQAGSQPGQAPETHTCSYCGLRRPASPPARCDGCGAPA